MKWLKAWLRRRRRQVAIDKKLKPLPLCLNPTRRIQQRMLEEQWPVTKEQWDTMEEPDEKGGRYIECADMFELPKSIGTVHPGQVVEFGPRNVRIVKHLGGEQITTEVVQAWGISDQEMLDSGYHLEGRVWCKEYDPPIPVEEL